MLTWNRFKTVLYSNYTCIDVFEKWLFLGLLQKNFIFIMVKYNIIGMSKQSSIKCYGLLYFYEIWTIKLWLKSTLSSRLSTFCLQLTVIKYFAKINIFINDGHMFWWNVKLYFTGKSGIIRKIQEVVMSEKIIFYSYLK